MAISDLFEESLHVRHFPLGQPSFICGFGWFSPTWLGFDCIVAAFGAHTKTIQSWQLQC